MSQEWERGVQQFAGVWNDVGSAVVVGTDPVRAAHLALAIARSQTARRRVAVGDLVGDLEPLRTLIGISDCPGISDSFTYGVSLNRVARLATGTTALFVIPSGTEPVAVEEIFRSTRWKRIADGFRDAGALLLLVAPATTPGLQTLISATDGVILAGEVFLPDSAIRVVARVPARRVALPTPSSVRARPTPAAPRPPVAPPHFDAPTAAAPPARIAVTATPLMTEQVPFVELAPVAAAPITAPVQSPKPPVVPVRRRTPRMPSVVDAPRRASRQRVFAVLAAVGGMALLAVAARSFVLNREPDGATANAATQSQTGGPPEQQTASMLPEADSLAATPWAVEVVSTNTPLSAYARLESVRTRPAATIAPGLVGDDWSWYRVVIGAYPDREGAQSLLVALARDRVIDGQNADRIVRLPYALLLATSVPTDSVESRASHYYRMSIPAYAMRQADGTVRLLAGAFATPEQTAPLASLVRSAGVEPLIVYRTGRPF